LNNNTLGLHHIGCKEQHFVVTITCNNSNILTIYTKLYPINYATTIIIKHCTVLFGTNNEHKSNALTTKILQYPDAVGRAMKGHKVRKN